MCPGGFLLSLLRLDQPCPVIPNLRIAEGGRGEHAPPCLRRL